MDLEGKIDEIVDLLIEGQQYREIAAKFDVTLSKLVRFLAKTENAALVSEGLQFSADQYADKAEQVLKDAESDSVEISRARELAQHYRWKASKRNPRRFGDKLDLTSDGDKLPNCVPNVIVYNSAPPLSANEDEVS